MGGIRVCELVRWCDEVGIRFVTVWALSPDNLQRSPSNVAVIVGSVSDSLRELAAAAPRWRIRFIGNLDLLPADCVVPLHSLEGDTAHRALSDGGATLNVAIAYSGRTDIAEAVHTLLCAHQGKELDGTVVESLLNLYTSTSGQPDPELVIRTSGEQRLSGFMPWQTAYAELYFTSTLWPDFDRNAFHEALRWYAQRSRRFGI